MIKKRYNSYKDSGVEWIGEIPNGWTIWKVAHMFQVNRWRVIDKTIISNEQNDENPYPVYSSQTLKNGCLWYIQTFDYNKDSLTRTTDGANAWSVFFRQWKFNCTNVCWILTLYKSSNDYQYLRYIVSLAWLNNRRWDILWYKLMSNEMASIRIPVPTPSEQQAIASYLDEKTATIDELIKKKKKQIKLLEEKRTALINQAVTRWLDPDVELVDSGVELIGKIPKGWEVRKLKYCCDMKSGKSITSNDIDKEWLYPVFWWNWIRGYYSFYTHDGEYVLIGRQWALCWNIKHVSGKFWASEHAVVVDTFWDTDTYWLWQKLTMMNLWQYSVASAQPGIWVDMVQNLYVSIPSYNEQKKISQELQVFLDKVSFSVRKIEKSIDTLKEYKQSLISHVVTGKFKVF